MPVSQWSDRERVVETINNNPGLTADMLAENLSQADLDGLQAKMFPPASPEQKKLTLEKSRRLLLRNGYAEADRLIQDMDGELASIDAAMGG